MPSGFNFTGAMRVLCADMVGRVDRLSHIQLDRVAISFSQTRKNVAHGLQASLTPLRFEQGAQTCVRRGRKYRCQEVLDAKGTPYLYILNFYVPRFLNHGLEEKLSTIAHELWHISPEFDGDIRRHAGRYFVHGSSQDDYDRRSEELAREWLAADPPAGIYAFLELNFGQLVEEYGGVYGTKIPLPKLIATK